MAPLIQLLVTQLTTHAPPAQKVSALRELKVKNEELQRAQAKLATHGLTLTPRKDPKHRSSAAAPPADPAPAPATSSAPPTLDDILQPSHPALRDDCGFEGRPTPQNTRIPESPQKGKPGVVEQVQKAMQRTFHAKAMRASRCLWKMPRRSTPSNQANSTCGHASFSKSSQ